MTWNNLEKQLKRIFKKEKQPKRIFLKRKKSKTRAQKVCLSIRNITPKQEFLKYISFLFQWILNTRTAACKKKILDGILLRSTAIIPSD